MSFPPSAIDHSTFIPYSNTLFFYPSKFWIWLKFNIYGGGSCPPRSSVLLRVGVSRKRAFVVRNSVFSWSKMPIYIHLAWLCPSTAVDKTVFQCTKFWIEEEAPIRVVEVVPPDEIGIIWGVLVFLFNFSAFWTLRSQFHENLSRLFDFYLRTFSSLWSRCHLFFYLRPDSSSGVAPLLESALRSKKRWHRTYSPQNGFVLFCRRPF